MNLRILPKATPKPEAAAPAPRSIRMCEAATRTEFQIMSMHLPAALRRPLEKMGIVPGRKAKLLHNDHKGTVVMELGGESFILGRRETRHIQIRIR